MHRYISVRRATQGFNSPDNEIPLRAGSQYTISLMVAQVDPNGNPLNYNLTTERLLWPIPQAERDLDVNLTQNTGY